MARININRVFISGNLTHDPELRYTPNGQAVTNFQIANNRKYRDQSGEWKEETSFLRIVAWARQAEVCSEYLKKGSPVLVEGRLVQRSWQTPEGQKRSVVEIRAFRVHFLSAAPRVEAVEEKAVEEKVVEEALPKEEEGEEEIPF
ncbi:MAG TPA: single-stranded DNA-binding protein [bacterium]|nr:single-stranded DNA-binding protein [bacterium]